MSSLWSRPQQSKLIMEMDGGRRMRFVRDARLLERIYILLQDCGMPDKRPGVDLIYELYWMLEEHFEEENE